jgi:hypothetical protein
MFHHQVTESTEADISWDTGLARDMPVNDAEIVKVFATRSAGFGSCGAWHADTGENSDTGIALSVTEPMAKAVCHASYL